MECGDPPFSSERPPRDTPDANAKEAPSSSSDEEYHHRFKRGSGSFDVQCFYSKFEIGGGVLEVLHISADELAKVKT